MKTVEPVIDELFTLHYTGSRSRIKLGIVVVIHFVVSNKKLVPTIDAPVQSVPWVLKSKVKRKPPFKILEKTSKPGFSSIPHSFFRQIFVCTRRISSWTLLITSVFCVFWSTQLASCHPYRFTKSYKIGHRRVVHFVVSVELCTKIIQTIDTPN